MTRFWPLLFLGVALLVGRAAAGQGESTNAGPHSDPRLERAVTVAQSHVYLGELLEQLTAATRVPLSVDDSRAPFSGIQVTVLLKNRPLREVMDGLREILSHKYNRCEWQERERPVGGQARRGFVLIFQHAPEAASQAARKAISSQWAQDLRTYHEIARLPEPERTQRGTAWSSDLWPASPLQSGFGDLMGSLRAPDLEVLLRGGMVTFDRARLSGPASQALNFGMPGTSSIPNEMSVSPAFYVTWTPDFFGPVLWVRNERSGAMTVLGGIPWDRRWFRTSGEGWADEGHDQALALGNAMTRTASAEGARTPDTNLLSWMKRVADRQDMNLIFDPVYPGRSESTATGWQGRTVEQTAFALVVGGDLCWKAQGELQLFRDKGAMTHTRRHLVRWSTVKGLRQAAEDNKGYLPFQKLVELAQLSPEQLEGLSTEFPDAHPTPMLQWRPLLEFYLNLTPALRRRVQTSRGIPFHETGLVSRSALDAAGPTNDLIGIPVLAQSFRTAVVSLRVERPKAAPLARPIPAAPTGVDPSDEEVAEAALQAAIKKADARNSKSLLLVWEISGSSGVLHRRTLFLRQREPLEPDWSRDTAAK